jgi:hypothetical protein
LISARLGCDPGFFEPARNDDNVFLMKVIESFLDEGDWKRACRKKTRPSSFRAQSAERACRPQAGKLSLSSLKPGDD